MIARDLDCALIAIALLAAACSATQLTPAPTRIPATPTIVSLPTPMPVSVTKDVAYTIPLQPDISEDRLDIYTPIAQKDLPLVIFAHGYAEHKEDYARLYEKIAEQGAAVFGIEWPDRSPLATANDTRKRSRHVSDVFACAIRFARSRFGGDSAPLILMGFSAGAGVGGAFALGGEEQVGKWDGLDRVAPMQLIKCVANGGSVHVDAFVGIAGPYSRGESTQKDDPQLWHLINPYALIGDNKSLRVRLLHGQFDTVVPMDSSLQFNDALTRAGYDSKLIKFESGHVVPFDLATAEVVTLFK